MNKTNKQNTPNCLLASGVFVSQFYSVSAREAQHTEPTVVGAEFIMREEEGK